MIAAQPERAAPPESQSSESVNEIVVTGAKRMPRAANDAIARDGADEAAQTRGGLARPAQRRALNVFGQKPAGAVAIKSEALTGSASDPAARLRAAAAAGRIADVAALLDSGVPIDTPDDEGDTALMQSVRADHPAAAAFLRRRGASLDHKNRAGESARDIAAEKGDAALNRAIGVAP